MPVYLPKYWSHRYVDRSKAGSSVNVFLLSKCDLKSRPTILNTFGSGFWNFGLPHKVTFGFDCSKAFLLPINWVRKFLKDTGVRSFQNGPKSIVKHVKMPILPDRFNISANWGPISNVEWKKSLRLQIQNSKPSCRLLQSSQIYSSLKYKPSSIAHPYSLQ